MGLAQQIVKDLVNIDIDNRIKVSSNKIEQAINHIKLLHKNDDGWITVAIKQENTWTQHHYKENDLVDNIFKLISIQDANIYLSANSFYTPKRKIETIRKLNALYIDLDYYNIEAFKGLNSEQVIWLLEKDYFNKEVPVPNFIVSSGRGLAIYWLIEPVPGKTVLPLWNAIQKFFLDKLKEIGADEKSIDSARVLRLSGSTNQKSKTIANLNIYEENYKYSLREIQENFLPELTPYVKNPGHKSKGRKTKVVNFYNVYRLHYSRLKDIVTLLELREGYCRMEDGSLRIDGQREFLCFLYRYWSCCYTDDTTKALEDTLEFNSNFAEPLRKKDVERITLSAETAYQDWLKDEPNGIYSRGGYNYKNVTLISKLNITLEEQQHLITIISEKEVKRRKNVYNKSKFKAKRRNEEGLTSREQAKADRLESIKALKNEGLNQSEIAKELGISRQAVSKLIKELK